ncbi:MAG: hypothetical protein WBA59_04005 [Moheibacter sp.]
MPAELRTFVIQNAPNPSPYNRIDSGSFYDCTDKSWDYTPDGSIRVSDHWNFYSRGKYHCLTDICNDRLIGKWAVGKYNAETGLYHIISIDGKDTSAYELRTARRNAKYQRVDPNSLPEIRKARAAQIRREKEAAVRAKKIRNGALGLKGSKIWAEVEVNVWSRKRGRMHHEGTETIFGCIVWESKNGSWFRIKNAFGHVREIRSWVNYKEFKRKPKM